MPKYNRAAAIRLAASVKDEDIDYSDLPDVTELEDAGLMHRISPKTYKQNK